MPMIFLVPDCVVSNCSDCTSNVLGCDACNAGLFFYLPASTTQQLPECLAVCPLGYYGNRNTSICSGAL